MSTSNDLYNLIKVLNRSEKRHFKLFASKHVIGKRNNYVELFDAIDAQENYNEAKLKHKLRNKVPVSYLSELKNYLTELILKSLETYHSKNVDTQIRSLIHQSEILLGKRQFNLCSKALKKVRKLAEKYEKNSYLLEILRLQFELYRATSYTQVKEENVSELFEKSKEVLNKTINSTSYRELSAMLFMHFTKHGYSTDPSKIKVVERIMNNELFMDEAKPHGYISKYSYYQCKTAYYFMKGDVQQAYTNVKKLNSLIDENIHQVKEQPKQHIAAINNLMVCEMALRKYSSLPKTIAKLRGLEYKSKESLNEIFYLSNITELELLINTGDFDKAVDLAGRIRKEQSQHAELSNMHERTLNLLLSISFLGIKDYKNALRFLNLIVNDSNLDLRSDIYFYAKILSLIVYFEMGKQDLLEYAVKSTYKFLLKHRGLGDFERIILAFLRNDYLKVATIREQKKAFEGLLVKLNETVEKGKSQLRFFDLITWLESKISDEPFAKLVKLKSKSKG